MVALPTSCSDEDRRRWDELRQHHLAEVYYPWLCPAELRRLEFWCYYWARRGRPPPQVLSPLGVALAHAVEVYLAAYGPQRRF